MKPESSRLAQNNFHLVRLICALVVCMYHASELSKFSALAWVPRVLSPNIALNAFFIISGFLISLSHERSKSTAQFFKKRFFRIYPAYFVVVLGTGFLCLGISTANASEYFGAKWWMYLVSNLFLLNFLQPTLPGVFTDNPFADVNGSLWTIKVEAFLYVTIPLLGIAARKFSAKKTAIIAYAAAVCWAVALEKFFQSTHAPILHHLYREIASPLSYFLAGALVYRHLFIFERFARVLAGGALSVLILNEFFPLPVLAPLALAGLVIFCSLFGFVGNLERYGDFSYGVYILHFPIIQALLRHEWCAAHPFVFLITVLCISLAGAKILWHLVERPFLALSSRYRTVHGGA